jgi:hypothetical protein
LDNLAINFIAGIFAAFFVFSTVMIFSRWQQRSAKASEPTTGAKFCFKGRKLVERSEQASLLVELGPNPLECWDHLVSFLGKRFPRAEIRTSMHALLFERKRFDISHTSGSRTLFLKGRFKHGLSVITVNDD